MTLQSSSLRHASVRHSDSNRCVCCSLITGEDFTTEGFEFMIQYLYSGSVTGVTTGVLSADKAAVALQAADFFGVTALRRAIEQCAQRCEATIEAV
jgi:hypothetical protein